MYTLRQYLCTADDSRGLTRTLGEIDVCRDAQRRPLYSAGNSAIVFRIRHAGGIRALRCYRRPMRHLRAIYGERLLEKELYLHTSPDTGVWVDAVLCDWIEGENLREVIATAALQGDTARLELLAASFDRLAAKLVADDRAHGDLKPENIIVGNDGELHPIDFDAAFLPAFAGERSPELGTAAFQHPSRTVTNFDSSLDDFPAALISTALHALSLDASLYTRYPGDGLLFCPQRIHSDPALKESLALFERKGMALQYRIGELLYSPALRLFGLAELLTHNVCEPGLTDAEPELFASNGRWGYRIGEHIVIPPLYDCGFDFSEDLAAVQLRRTWHFIDTGGRTVLSFPGCDAIKPFCEGRATVIRNERRIAVDHTGREFDI